MTLDIRSGGKYPACALSNFAGHRFIIDGIECKSMEGFLQSLKFKSIEMQIYICTLIGKKAKMKGVRKNWKTKQILYWRGNEIKRNSLDYQLLIAKAFHAMGEQSKSFRRALEASRGIILTHSLGNNNPKQTVLTKQEFIKNLNLLRITI